MPWATTRGNICLGLLKAVVSELCISFLLLAEGDADVCPPKGVEDRKIASLSAPGIGDRSLCQDSALSNGRSGSTNKNLTQRIPCVSCRGQQLCWIKSITRIIE
ncbi:hypothetical protein PR003_g13619 [Phytophthora rubi]|uniref:Secreted protein n=1 Tax=Phytophthora rubi TaxID=129364 RepID=A0A6A3LYT7_9STRA|nr:hypothetical protein PR001_g12704 [Phytophthora rubi]KAE9029690.1 hypothetical protein PR002_g10073 [Phytophthora rubi]KAE9334245.1 hypothetical protein PR003_g13619 [Phytophthora rubi]